MTEQVISRVFNPDGSPGGATLDPQEWALQDVALKHLLRNRRFQQTFPGAVLCRVEVRRGQEAARVRVCLQFEVPGQGGVRFWVQWGKRMVVDVIHRRIVVPLGQGDL